jgi:3-oxoadipate enol-lactonase
MGSERAQKALDSGMSALIEFQKSRWFSDAFRSQRPDIVEHVIAVFLANDVRAYADSCRMLGALDKRQALAQFDFPCVVLVGSDDYATPPAMARALEAGIAGAKLHVIQNVRHFTPLEVPHVIAAHTIDLLQARGKR